MGLEEYGWSDSLRQAFRSHAEAGLRAARVIVEHRGAYRLFTESGELPATVRGRLLHDASSASARPVVGDWVGISGGSAAGESARIDVVLPRRTQLSRNVPGKKTVEQVVAANVDQVFLVMGLDEDFNLRRLERLLVMTWESGAQPTVLLNKDDLCPDRDARKLEVEGVAPGVPIHVLSCLERRGLESVREAIHPGETVALVGSSGVGKSTLINELIGRELLKTREVRASDGRGQHTTTHRELFLIPGGGLLIDNPGVRELQLWSAEHSLERGFADVEELGRNCRFADCTHGTEPDCAVIAAVQHGRLGQERLDSFLQLRREVLYLARKRDEAAAQIEKKKWRVIHRGMKRDKRKR